MSDSAMIIGMWNLDSVSKHVEEEIIANERQEFKKQMYFNFAVDSVFTMPEFSGGIKTGRWYLSDNSIYVNLDRSNQNSFKGVGYVFIRPDYLRIGEGDSLMYYNRN